MAFRLYVVPVIGAGTRSDPRRPKYVDSATTAWTAIDYGFEPWFIVGADLSPTDDASLAAQADVTALPFNLDPVLTAANVITVQNKLEAANIPAGWVNTTQTWREVVRTVLGVFTFLQRYGCVYANATGVAPPSIFTAGVTLNTTFGSLPAAVRTALLETATTFGLPTTGLTAGSTLRQILKAMADFFQGRGYAFGGVAI